MLPKYGIIQDGNLILSENCLEGYKLVVYAEIPEFNQGFQAVFQIAPADKGDYVEVGIEVRELPPSEDDVFEM